MTRDTAIAIGLGAISAGFLLTTLTGSMGALIFTYLTPLPLFVAGLAFGLPKALIASVAGLAGASYLGLPTALTYGLAVAAPAVLLTRQALLQRVAGDQGAVEWYPPGLLLAWLAGIAGAGFVTLALLYSGGPNGLPGLFEPSLTQMFQALGIAEAKQAAAMAAIWAPLIPTMLAVAWMLLIAVNGILAQGLAVQLHRNLRPSPDIAAIELPQALLFALAIAVAAHFVAGLVGFVGEGLAMILAVPFVFQGLAVVHVLARRSALKWPLLVGFYLMLMIFGGLLLLVAVLGLIEQWAHLRRRFAGMSHGEEDA